MWKYSQPCEIAVNNVTLACDNYKLATPQGQPLFPQESYLKGINKVLLDTSCKISSFASISFISSSYLLFGIILPCDEKQDNMLDKIYMYN